MLEIKVDDRELKALQRNIKALGGKMPSIMSRALNKTIITARAEMAREIARRMKMRIGKVKEKTDLFKATYSNWRASIKLSSRRIPLIQQQARQTKVGVRYWQAKTQTRTVIQSAFIATMPSGHKGVFARATIVKGLYRQMKGKNKEAIYELRGPSLAQLYGNDEILKQSIYNKAEAKLEQNISNQVQLLLKRKGLISSKGVA